MAFLRTLAYIQAFQCSGLHESWYYLVVPIPRIHFYLLPRARMFNYTRVSLSTSEAALMDKGWARLVRAFQHAAALDSS